MYKRGILSKAEKHCINTMLESGKSVKEIARFLSRTKASVEKFLIIQKKMEDEKKQKPLRPTAKDFMINRTQGKHDKSVSIMTKEASAKGDEHRNKIYEPNRLSKNAIHRINEDGKEQD